MKKLMFSLLLLTSLGVSQLHANCLNEFSADVNTAEQTYDQAIVEASVDAFLGDPFSFLNTATQAYFAFQESIHSALTHLCWCDGAWCY